jgi:hypothetical protein
MDGLYRERGQRGRQGDTERGRNSTGARYIKDIFKEINSR